MKCSAVTKSSFYGFLNIPRIKSFVIDKANNSNNNATAKLMWIESNCAVKIF